MFTPLTIVKNKTKGCWSICLYHKASKRRYWLDVGLDEQYHELEVEWNQYIFWNSDPDDQERKAFQEDCDNFEAACEAVYAILESEVRFFTAKMETGILKMEEKDGRQELGMCRRARRL